MRRSGAEQKPQEPSSCVLLVMTYAPFRWALARKAGPRLPRQYCRRFSDAEPLHSEKAGLPQVEAAKRLGKAQQFVSKCETGECRVM